MYKDGRWAPMGKGIIDFKSITQELKETGFEGWIILEDECDEAITDPDGVTMADGIYLKEVLEPILNRNK
jgi:inosose dehydratase